MSEDYNANSEPTPTDPATLPLYINPKMLKRGTALILAGESDIYELTLLYPEHGIAEITSNLPPLRAVTVGQFLFSVRWDQPGVRRNVIQQGWALMLRFRNGEYQTQPILTASVHGQCEDGSRWSYDVF
jgi:hypothetical protein